jgi:hypothetical protein
MSVPFYATINRAVLLHTMIAKLIYEHMPTNSYLCIAGLSRDGLAIYTFG